MLSDAYLRPGQPGGRRRGPLAERVKIARGNARRTSKLGSGRSLCRWCEKLPEQGAEAVTERARALESYLRDSGQFHYTLEMGVNDARLDPVEDFLVNRKKGHCEYFSSALALLLRSIDIPTRVVNGFKGGDWNDLTQSMNVRQKHAHSWVEAYVGHDAQNSPIWITLDATPVVDRDESVAAGGRNDHEHPPDDRPDPIRLGLLHPWI